MAAFLAKMVIPRSRSWSVGVHHPVDDSWWAANVPVAQQGVDEGRLAMVDVRDDGDIAQVLTGGHSCNRRAEPALGRSLCRVDRNHADPVQVEEIVWVARVDRPGRCASAVAAISRSTARRPRALRPAATTEA